MVPKMCCQWDKEKMKNEDDDMMKECRENEG